MQQPHSLDWFIFWLSSLACYRITILFARDIGPFGIFKRLRSGYYSGTFFSCPYCVSVWSGALTAFALYLSGFSYSPFQAFTFWIIVALAFSAVAIALDRMFSSDHTT